MSGMRETRPEAPHGACLRPGVCRDLTCACARSACQPERNATAVGLPRPAAHGKCVCLRVCACVCTRRICWRVIARTRWGEQIVRVCAPPARTRNTEEGMKKKPFWMIPSSLATAERFPPLVFALPSHSGRFVSLWSWPTPGPTHKVT